MKIFWMECDQIYLYIKQKYLNWHVLFRFMVVRHPFERLLSAYRDKLEDLSRDIEARDGYYFTMYGKQVQYSTVQYSTVQYSTTSPCTASRSWRTTATRRTPTWRGCWSPPGASSSPTFSTHPSPSLTSTGCRCGCCAHPASSGHTWRLSFTA